MGNSCTVDGAVIDFTDTGSGPVVVFVHGVYVGGAIWQRVVAALGGRVRCIVPTWPLGAHLPVGRDVDLGAGAAARRIVAFLDQLDLHDVTVVANDTGGGLVLAALGDPSLDVSRIASLVFTNCDSYEHFPPGQFKLVVQLCRRSPAVGRAMLAMLASPVGQKVFLRAVCRTRLSAGERAELFGAFLTNKSTRAQAATVTASLDPALTLRAVDAIQRFDKPVAVVWGTEDKLFPFSDAERLARDFPRATLITIPHSLAYVMIDAPQELASAIVDIAAAS